MDRQVGLCDTWVSRIWSSVQCCSMRKSLKDDLGFRTDARFIETMWFTYTTSNAFITTTSCFSSWEMWAWFLLAPVISAHLVLLSYSGIRVQIGDRVMYLCLSIYIIMQRGKHALNPKWSSVSNACSVHKFRHAQLLCPSGIFLSQILALQIFIILYLCLKFWPLCCIGLGLRAASQ